MSVPNKKRQPAQLEMVGGKGTRQIVWEAIRKLGKPFTTVELVRKLECHDVTVEIYLRSLEAGGFLSKATQAGRRGQQKIVWQLIKDNGMEAPRLKRDGKPVTQGLGTESMWRCMRIVGEFNFRELAAHASAGQVKVSEGAAKQYIQALSAAGYLTTVKPTSVGRAPAPARYRLVAGKYTGPRPPMIQRTKSVYDPNLDEVVYQSKDKTHDDL